MRTVSLKEAQGMNFGSVFLDNLTLSCALRAIRGYDPLEIPLEYILYKKKEQELKNIRGTKWDYTASEAFRFGIDVLSLAQVIESIVLFDKIFVDISHINRWGFVRMKGTKEIEISGIAHILDPLVIPVAVNRMERLTLLNHVLNQVKTSVENGVLQEFLHLLLYSSVDGTFISMSDGYFRTGFSDGGIFPETDWRGNAYEWIYDTILNEKSKGDVFALVPEKVKSSIDPRFISLWNQFANEAASILQHSFADRLLKDTKCGDNDLWGKAEASIDILRSAIAAHFYEFLASSCGVSYLPHVMRSYFILLDRVNSNKGYISTSQSIINMLQEARKRRIQSINTFYQGSAVDIHIPFLLAMVLKDVTRPEEILDAAIALRESPYAKDFRAWAAELDRQIAKGDANIEKLTKELDKARGIIAQWMYTTKTTASESVEWTISLGPVGITIPMRRPRVPNFSRPRHLLFIQRLAQLNHQTPKFETLIHKVFGQKPAEMWHHYQHVVEKFRYPKIDILGKRSYD